MRYGNSVITGFSFDEAVEAAKQLLRDEGFGDSAPAIRASPSKRCMRSRISDSFSLHVVVQELSDVTVASAVDARAADIRAT